VLHRIACCTRMVFRAAATPHGLMHACGGSAGSHLVARLSRL
jgi:hypothetical protein